MKKTQIASVIGALLLVFFTFLFNGTMISKADCIGIVDNAIKDHEDNDSKFQKMVDERLSSIQQDVREIRAREK